MNETSFCALVELLLTKLNHYFDVYIHTNVLFWPFKVTLKIGDTAPLEFVEADANCRKRRDASAKSVDARSPVRRVTISSLAPESSFEECKDSNH